MEGLAIGRIVLYTTNDGRTLPAIVTKVDGGLINLNVQSDGSHLDTAHVFPALSVAFDEEGGQGNTWHWPKRS